jgi:hypothetical protein
MHEATLKTISGNSSLASKVRDWLKDEPMGPTPWLLCDALYAIAREGTWCGTAATLLIHLQKKVPKRLRLLREWPVGPADLTWQTRRSVDHLHNVGVDVTFLREKKMGEQLIQGGQAQPSVRGLSTRRCRRAAAAVCRRGSRRVRQGRQRETVAIATVGNAQVLFDRLAVLAKLEPEEPEKPVTVRAIAKRLQRRENIVARRVRATLRGK